VWRVSVRPGISRWNTLGEGNGTPLQHSCLKIPWMEEPGRLQSMRSLRVGHDWVTSLSLFTFMRWRRKWQPTPVFLPGESQGRGSLVGCRLWVHTVGHDWSDLTAHIHVYTYVTLNTSITVALVTKSSLTLCCAHLCQLFATLRTPLSMGFFRQEYWNGLPFSPSQPKDWTHVCCTVR